MYASSSAAYPIDLQQVRAAWSGLLPSASAACNVPSAMRITQPHTVCAHACACARVRVRACGVSVCARVCVRACVFVGAYVCARARVCRFLRVDVSVCSHGARARVCDRFTLRDRCHTARRVPTATQRRSE